jgi:hypothetical protein
MNIRIRNKKVNPNDRILSLAKQLIDEIEKQTNFIDIDKPSDMKTISIHYDYCHHKNREIHLTTSPYGSYHIQKEFPVINPNCHL